MKTKDLKKLNKKYQDVDSLYATTQRTYSLSIHSNVRMICAILKVSPKELLQDFLATISYSYYQDGKIPLKRMKAAKKYFLSCHYGKDKYDDKAVELMLEELKAQQSLHYHSNDFKGSDLDLYWMHQWMFSKQWFKKWFYKNHRKEDQNILDQY